jgi:hypothetical protein
VPFNLTESQKSVIRWMVQENRAERLPDEFGVVWMSSGSLITTYLGGDQPELTRGSLDALAASDLILCSVSYRTKTSTRGTRRNPKLEEQRFESSRHVTLTAKAFEAVDNDFSAPDTSFVTQLTPLADVTNLDEELKQRVLPILGAGSADPVMWDSAVRVASVILEERLRAVGDISDDGRVGQDLVNAVFGSSGSLADRFSRPSDQQGYRDLYAGVVGVFRNRYAHRLVDPTPEDGGAFIVFVNLLLKMLEDLRSV